MKVVDEPLLFDTAWMIAMDTGCSGFDSYFVALAIIKSATLITDDNGMHRIARGIGVDSILVRDADAGTIEGLAEAEQDSDADR